MGSSDNPLCGDYEFRFWIFRGSKEGGADEKFGVFGGENFWKLIRILRTASLFFNE
jgi:hypothetical protein